MPKITKHEPGSPSWADLSTTDDSGAVKFYGSLFGWTDDPQEMGPDSYYHMQRLDGQSVAGISKQGEEELAQNIPPHWNTYFTVDNADEAAQKAKDAGRPNAWGRPAMLHTERRSALPELLGYLRCVLRCTSG